MLHDSTPIDELYAQLQAATTPAHLTDVIHRAAVHITKDEASDDYDRVRLGAFVTLAELPKIEGDNVAQLIVDELLPLCVESSLADANIKLFSMTRYRDVLTDWLTSLDEPERTSVRATVIAALFSYLEGPQAESASWLLAQIGFRSQESVDRLWRVAERDDTAGAAALAALALFGPDSVGRGRLREATHRRLPDRFSMGLLGALRRLADPASIEPILRSSWFEPPEGDAGGVTPVWWTVTAYATRSRLVHLLSNAAGDR